MWTQTQNNVQNHFQCLGVGVGPANLSLASLLYNNHEVSNRFIEKQPSFGWHDGQQVDGATLQVSMLKDLVTLSDPTNEFSFLSYLHSHGRPYHAWAETAFDLRPAAQRDAVVSPTREPADLAAIGAHLDWANAVLARDEQVRSVVVARTRFSIDNGLLTSQYKPRRKQIFEHFRTTILANQVGVLEPDEEGVHEQ